MILKDIIKLYKIGKELGLTRKEINGVLLFKNRYPLVIVLILIVILTVFAVFFWNIALFLYMRTTEPVYPEGALYSSISIKDFKDKK